MADTLSERIRTGVLRAGERMPTQETLADEFGVERAAIRQALQLLEDAGLLAGRTRGAPARIAGRPSGAPPAAGEPQQTAAGLGPRIMEAFEAPDVRIDAICLTAESLNAALADPLQLIRAGQITPDTVRFRLLLPSRNLDLAFPRPAEKSGDDKRVHEHWLGLRNSHGAVLRHSLRALRSTRSIDVEVSFKALPFTPPVKLYLLNGSEALFAYYTVKRREEQIDDRPVEIYDVLGSDSTLFPFERGGGTRDEAFVTQSQAWFDSLWDTIAMEITLGR
ncbi:GntR family transcriptional regulator [Streptomyces sp. ISL-1]|uniref:winged helix-turn-helix domain-containing protein n=1 Tax=Streptomyces sp. ISL-1 TaxID=2817657 RepID=UPI0027E4DB21|nr:GntR family transcriptional regulator [Streptomyces sp. ISL-1]